MSTASDGRVSVPDTPRRLRRISIQSKLLVMLLLTSVLSVAVVGAIGFQSGRQSLRDAAFERLTLIRSAQGRLLEKSLSDLTSSMVVYTRGATAEQAIAAFTAGFNELRDAEISPEQQQALVDYYQRNYGEPDHDTTQAKVQALLPKPPAQRYLQAHYTVRADHTDGGANLDDAGDGSAWSAANAKYNEYFRQVIKRQHSADALLIDPRGIVVYSVDKGIDLGTNLLYGPYRGTNLAEAFKEAMNSNSLDEVVIRDFDIYQPSGRPTAWMVSPIGPPGSVSGVLALALPVDNLNRGMTFGGDWQGAGLGKTGETILVGPDLLMRSESRLFIEDPDAYRTDVVEAGTPVEVADEAVRLGSTILVQPVDTEAVKRALQGGTGTLITTDYEGHRTLQAYSPVQFTGLNWVLVAKIDVAEASAPVAAFTRTLVLSTVAIILVVCIAALLLARVFVRPIRRLEAGAGRIGAGDYDVALPVTSRDEFGDLTKAFNDMSSSLRTKEDQLNEQRDENNRLLLSLMPESVVQRYREGEQNIAQEHQNVTVIFANVDGLEKLADTLTANESLGVVNQLVRQFDAAAENLGIERVRTLHDGYLASCGLTLPRLDNARRTVDFAIEMHRIVERFNAETGHRLRLRAGINTGSVTSGLLGRSNLVYDIWGAAVTTAYELHKSPPEAGIYVTEVVYLAMRDVEDFGPAGKITVNEHTERVWRLSGERR
ncbi:HAMP domain-containing protein [Mycobacterium sp. Y57]|uniref:adenylate/guanylate cyclase domain-containing protein n=1 Tax=Mycolicibacterium xanthum TaxID=2796469 RepID=UPI001C84D0BA|nr:adenylate/guanylate cyclase domain-containing protein [Mycolicibacterium xanthum]MBX7434607.1 HAMP domain-containing protein [Mycolicibacterium xanthum]